MSHSEKRHQKAASKGQAYGWFSALVAVVVLEWPRLKVFNIEQTADS